MLLKAYKFAGKYNKRDASYETSLDFKIEALAYSYSTVAVGFGV